MSQNNKCLSHTCGRNLPPIPSLFPQLLIIALKLCHFVANEVIYWELSKWSLSGRRVWNKQWGAKQVRACCTYQTDLFWCTRAESNNKKRNTGFCILALSCYMWAKSVNAQSHTTDVWDKASGMAGKRVYVHFFMQSSSSRRKAMRVCQPRGRMRM